MDIREITQSIRWAEGTSEITRRGAMQRIRALTDAIESRFPHVRRSNQIKQRHMEFLQNVWFDRKGFAPATKADYIRAMRLMITAMEKDRYWFGPLGLVENRQRGGRPTAARITRSRSRRHGRKI